MPRHSVSIFDGSLGYVSGADRLHYPLVSRLGRPDEHMRRIEDALRSFDEHHGTQSGLRQATHEMDGPVTLHVETTAPPHIARHLPDFLRGILPEGFAIDVRTTHLEQYEIRTGGEPLGMVRGSYGGRSTRVEMDLPVLSGEALDRVATNYDAVRRPEETDVEFRERLQDNLRNPYSTERRAPAAVKAKLGKPGLAPVKKPPVTKAKPPTRYDMIADDWLDLSA
jgi:hypothetical protein